MQIKLAKHVQYLALFFISLLVSCGGGSASNDVSAGAPPTGSSNYWSWMKGSNVRNQKGTYGTLGVAAAGNVPGGREGAVGWLDSGGNRWIFGGAGYDSAGTLGNLNDLWKFDGSNWIWMSGSDVVYQRGLYGTLGVPAAGNIPGARIGALSTTDTSGNLWFFGGNGYGATGYVGNLNDLWKFDGSKWSWVSGSDMSDESGVYGTLGVASANNIPGGRSGGISWMDGSGNLWIFGGEGQDATGARFYLNDLWKFDGSNWTWVSGSNVIAQKGVYGIKGVAAAGNTPGARFGVVRWLDSSGKLWLFGGCGYDANGNLGYLNDLWKFDGNNWIWVSGSSFADSDAVYGMQGSAAAGNVPAGRSGGVTWIDSSGQLWLFGGYASYFGAYGQRNDLWKFDGSNWTWMSGSKDTYKLGIYGTPGIASSGNTPGTRSRAVSWIDGSGKIWLFGGYGTDSTGTEGELNDLWRFEP